MHLEIISPEKTLFKGEVESILFPGTYGDFQVLNNHAPIVSTLTKGKVKIDLKKDLNGQLYLPKTQAIGKPNIIVKIVEKKDWTNVKPTVFCET